MSLADDVRRAAESGKFFRVEFIKRGDGSVRKMTCRGGVKRYLKGGSQPYEPAKYDLLTVYDVQQKGYRNIDLNTVQNLKVNGIETKAG